MKRVFLIGMILLLSFSLLSCTKEKNGNQSTGTVQQNEAEDRQNVTALVKDFGQKLQLVSLQAPPAVVQQSMKDNYGSLVTPDLLAKWQSDPQKAPGRLVSSPWPERIDVLSVEKSEDSSYKVKGEIIELTSMEKVGGGSCRQTAHRPFG